MKANGRAILAGWVCTICAGQVEQDTENYDTIRHVLAVHPVEVWVPFVLADVLIPTF